MERCVDIVPIALDGGVKCALMESEKLYVSNVMAECFVLNAGM